MRRDNTEPIDNILEAIGWTPLVRLNRITRGIRTPVYAKAENLNPGGSVKDRIALEIIEAAEKRGELKPGGTVVEATSGNTVGSTYTAYAHSHKKGEGFPYKVEGIGGDKIPTSLHFDVIDEWAFVSDAEAFQTSRRLTREEGLFTGGSTGVNVKVALDVARGVDDPEAMVVTILCDS